MFKRVILFIILNLTILYATIPTKESVTKLYIATFNRAPDSSGLNYWLNCGLSLEEIAESFFDQKETKELYPDNYSTKEFIDAIYQNVLGRSPDKDGFDYWQKELDSHRLSRSVFILAIINGALGDDAKLLENKTEVGLYFVSKNLNDVELAKEVMRDITADESSVAKAKALIDSHKTTIMDKFISNGYTAMGINSPESLPFFTNDGKIEWLDIFDLMFDNDIEDKLVYLKDYNPFSFYRYKMVLQNTDFVTLWFTRNWDESWFNIDKIQKYLDSGRFLVINYWYFGDTLNYIPGDEELKYYYENVQRVSNFISKLHGNILLIFEPEFNKYFLTSSEENSKAFANIISKAIDIVKSQNPDTLVSLCMMDTGIRDVNQNWDTCGYENCALGDINEWSRADRVYKYLIDKIDFLSFEQTLAQFSRDLLNPGTLTDPNPKAYTPQEMGIEYIDQRIINMTKYLHDKYNKPILLDYLGIGSATWSDKNGDGKIQDDEIDPNGWSKYINNTYRKLREEQDILIQNGLFGYAPLMVIDDPNHDKNGWQFYLQNEYHLGLMSSSAIPGVDEALHGDMVAKGSDLLENAFAPTKVKYQNILQNKIDECIEQEYANCDYIKQKLNFYIDKSNFPLVDRDKRGKLIPFYIYPDFANSDSKWQKLIDDRYKNNDRVVAVINPNNGDFDWLDKNYFDGIKALAKTHFEVVGYVHTGYAKRDINEVKKSIDNWDKYYKLAGVRGIFFDEVSTDIKDIDYYIELTNYATSKGFLFNVLNPGTNTHPAYFESDIANIIVSEEDSYDNFQNYEDKNNPTIFTKKAILLYDVDESSIDELNNYAIEHNFDFYDFATKNNATW